MKREVPLIQYQWSTDEHKIGKWYDGRDVYEKTFGGTLPSITAETDYGFSNSLPEGIDVTTMWVDYGNSFFTMGSGTSNHGTRQPGFCYTLSDWVSAWMSENGLAINLRYPSYYIGRNYALTIRYCKTA